MAIQIVFLIVMFLLGILPIFAQSGPSVSYYAVTWSPDSKYLSFTRMEMSDGQPRKMKADIYVMRPDGTEMKKITGDEAEEFAPSWSKDGRRIYFGSSVGGGKVSNIYSTKRDGSDLRQLTKDSGHNASPVVSPDGKWIIYNAEAVEHKPQIYIVKTDGSGVRALTNDPSLAFYNPSWSPDGKRIVYYVEKGDQKDQVWVMNSDGSDPTLLTGGVGHNFYPSWSADGGQIIFSSDRDGGERAIWTMNPDGTKIRRLDAVPSFYARYSPDGKKIVYIAGKFPKTAIVVANADGSNPVTITK